MANFPITIVFRDGETAQITCRDFETVVQAAERQNLRLLVDCREGACGTCKATLQSGQFSLDDYSEQALPEAERLEGRVLTCQMRPQSPCVVEFDYPMSAIRHGPAPVARRVSIVDIMPQTDDVIEVTLRSDDKRPFNFLPGQYANLQIPDTSTARSYSFINRPGSDSACFLVRLIQNGMMSQWLRQQSSSHASLLVTGPLGRFFLRDPGRPLLFVAGGTGVGPIISILDSMRNAGAAPPCVTLVFGVNSSAGLFHRHTLETLIGGFSAGKLLITAMSPDPSWDGGKGTAVDALDALEIVRDAHAYLCGPPAMVERAQAALTLRGLDKRSIFAEIFLPTADTEMA